MRRMIGRFAVHAFVGILSISLALANRALAQTETILDDFNSANGSYSIAPVIFDSAGNLYGTTDFGGANGLGVVFELTNSGGVWSENVLWSFAGGGKDGCFPYAGLAMDSTGNLYGTTTSCGQGGGTVFELTNSAGTWSETILHNFSGRGDGGFPTAGLVIDPKGNLYGTTENGGGGGCLDGCGVVFKLAQNNGIWKQTILHLFRKNDTDGVSPESNVILDKNGNVYGATSSGGASGRGVVFKLTKTKKGYLETLLYSFTGSADGGNPSDGLIADAAGNLYGTTAIGGASGDGTVFELSQINKKWTETVLHSFAGSDGSYPLGNLAFNSAGNLYGTTYTGGSSNLGSVFELVNSSGTWTETTLWNFSNNGTDGWNSHGVILDSAGNLYGATQQGGTGTYGIVYEITP